MRYAEFRRGLWWASTVVSTVSEPKHPVTFEGRVGAVFLRVFGLVVVGTSPPASRSTSWADVPRPKTRRKTDLADLREEFERLADLLKAPRGL